MRWTCKLHSLACQIASDYSGAPDKPLDATSQGEGPRQCVASISFPMRHFLLFIVAMLFALPALAAEPWNHELAWPGPHWRWPPRARFFYAMLVITDGEVMPPTPVRWDSER